MRFREILSVAIVGIALTDATVRADSLSHEPPLPPATSGLIPSTTEWGDAYTVPGTTLDERQYSTFPVAAPAPALAQSPVALHAPAHSKPTPVHALPLPPTVWSGATLLAVSAVVVWARRRRHAGEIVAA